MEYCDKCGYIKPQCECEEAMTNADKIRNMSDEELAEWLYKTIYHTANNLFKCENIPVNKCKDCKKCYLDWLQTEIK